MQKCTCNSNLYGETIVIVAHMGSSEVCREPAPVSPLSINKVAKAIPELMLVDQWNTDESFDASQRRLLSSLKFRLYLTLCNLGLGYTLHRRYTSNSAWAEQFLQAFEQACQHVYTYDHGENKSLY